MYKIQLIIISFPLLMFAAGWQNLSGPPAGRAVDMSIGGDTAGHYVIYNADDKHRVYRSTNDGENWIPLNFWYATCVIAQKNNGGTVYAGTWGSPPVYKSINSGDDWRPKSNGITNGNPLCFAMDPVDPQIIFLGCWEYPWIFRTTDGGDQWHEKPMIQWEKHGSLSQIATIRDTTNNPVTLAAYHGGASTSKGVYRSTDYGDTWERTLSIKAYSVEFASQNVAYAGGCEGYGIYKSEDGGSNWYPLPNVPEHTVIKDIKTITSDTVYIVTQDSGVYKATDGGSSWNPINDSIYTPFLHSLIKHPASSQTLLVCGDCCVYKTTNGGEFWMEKTKGYKPVMTITISAEDSLIWTSGYMRGFTYPGGWDLQVSKSSNNGNDWITAFSNQGRVQDTRIEACSNYPDTVYLASYVNEGGLKSQVPPRS